MQGTGALEQTRELAPVPVQAGPILPSPKLLPAVVATKRLLFVRALEAALAGRRVFVLLPFAAIAGLVSYAGLPFEPAGSALGAVGAAACLGACLALRNLAALRLAVLFAAFWGGFCLLPVHGALWGTGMLPFPLYGQYEAVIDEILSATQEDRRVVVSALRPLGEAPSAPINKARLLIPAEPPLQPGDTVRGQLRLAPVPGPVLPGAFDGQFHAYFAGIGAYGNATGAMTRVAEATDFNLGRSVEDLRRAVGARLDEQMEGASAAIARAMVVGDQSAITDETRDVMAASGLAHIYSISGLHLSIVAGGVFWLVRLLLASLPGLAVRWPVKKLAAVAGIAAAFSYLLLAGGLANVPALRSTIMLALIFGAVLAGRRALTMRNVAIAALVVILLDPASVFRASFQLSFAAVVALIGIYELPRRTPSVHRAGIARLIVSVGTAALTSFIAGTATLLFSAYHFQQTAPLGVIGNVLVLPVVSLVIMPFGVLSVLLMPLGLEAPFVAVMGWGIDRMVHGAVLVAGWSEGLTGNPLLTSTALLLGLAALAWFAFFPSRWRFLAPVAAIPLILLFGLDQRPDVLVADTTQAVAVRSETGLGLLTGRAGSFAVDVWGQHYQEEIAPVIDAARCDSLGCVVATEQFGVAVVRDVGAFAEDCARHDLVVTRLRAPIACRAQAQVIDRDDLARGGVHWLKWEDGEQRFVVRTAVPNLTRPWRVRSQ
ncbi:ComEC/Rec2 family competence protein [Devosia sp. 1566]|uniref:ComEC/Rec2 family competence protein n=1 Tax=Devosia sp. 1566 TaxID=2499144 RepID=UPI000FD899D5|nr:ComEC/Rec2 family competence protein [Devosia sp. 1566]